MSRFIFFLLIVANLAFAAHWWQSSPKGQDGVNSRAAELEPDTVKLTGVKSGKEAIESIEASRELQTKLAQSPCILISGISPTQHESAKALAAQAGISNQLLERPIEAIKSYWVYLPKPKDAKTNSETIAFLKKQRVDYSIMTDGVISLGVFSSDEASQRYLQEVRTKNVKLAQASPKTRETKEFQWLLRSPDESSAAKLATIRREMRSLEMRPHNCEGFTS
jgi:hypothetical protein